MAANMTPDVDWTDPRWFAHRLPESLWSRWMRRPQEERLDLLRSCIGHEVSIVGVDQLLRHQGPYSWSSAYRWHGGHLRPLVMPPYRPVRILSVIADPTVNAERPDLAWWLIDCWFLDNPPHQGTCVLEDLYDLRGD